MNFSNGNVYEAIIEIKDRYIYKLEDWLLIATLFAGLSTTCFASALYDDQHQITHIKSELRTKNKQIDGLHNQLTRTQYQLKKAKKQNVEQTQKIAELTRNGG